jgi:hypothetical protein
VKYIGFITLSFFSFNILAKELKSEHLLKPGDVLSADVLNEMFTNLIQLNKDPVEAELVGAWKRKISRYMSPKFSRCHF